MINPTIEESLRLSFLNSKRITVLTGAGVSAESGIPTFRGSEGYWTVGSKNYHPQEIATYAMFGKMRHEVWKWYLYRLGVCRSAKPNPGHLAIVEMEQILEDRFTLITQNVDGLHIRAGNSQKKTYQIHGNIDYMRCDKFCSMTIYPIPDDIPLISRGDDLSGKDWQLLSCPGCGCPTRPHVLLWDESYNEEYYRFHSALKVAEETDLLFIVGTTGATNLPNQIVTQVLYQGGTVIDLNIEKTRFSEMALSSNQGFFWQSPSGEALPQIAEILKRTPF
ncbi:MAG: RNA polymerase subunit sigma [Desulfamplus sp.]|nr:RNA polymerase subunit sigma [Desulfamplus sp.]